MLQRGADSSTGPPWTASGALETGGTLESHGIKLGHHRRPRKEDQALNARGRKRQDLDLRPKSVFEKCGTAAPGCVGLPNNGSPLAVFHRRGRLCHPPRRAERSF